MCNFDSFLVQAYSNSIRALMKIDGAKRENIQTKIIYGGRYPKREHTLYINGFQAQDHGFSNAAKLARDKMNSMPEIERVTYGIYHILGD